MRYPDLNPGDRYERLVVVRKTDEVRNGEAVYEFLCDCGKSHFACGGSARRGNVKSCGCYKLDKLIERSITHGHAKRSGYTPEYRAYRDAKNRCINPKRNRYNSYGGRGIRMCERWMASFEAFLEDMGSKPSSSHSLDRIDVNGNYEPGNCRWATAREQYLNKQNTLFAEIDGRRITLKDLAARFGVSYGSVWDRYNRGIRGYDLVRNLPRRDGILEQSGKEV